jgi:hypothetical protein
MSQHRGGRQMQNIITKADFTGSVFVTPHAIDKAMELFKIKNRVEARIFVLDNLRKSTYISEIVGEKGKTDRLFAHRRIAFVLDRVDDVVITIYVREHVDKELREEVKEIITDYIVRMHDEEKELKKEITALEVEEEILSQFVKLGLASESEYRWISRCVIRKEAELDASRRRRSKVAKGAVAFL